MEADLLQLLPDGVNLFIEASTGRASAQLANALLLITNEFVSNSVKHAFTGRSGKIEIVAQISEGAWSIVCRDNGTATAGDAERAATAAGLGTRVIQSLVASMGANAQWRAGGDGMELCVNAGSRLS